MNKQNESLKKLTALIPNFKKAWSEISSDPFEPDLNSIKFLIEHGLCFFEAEDIGFYAFTLGKHLLTSQTRADVITIYVYPQYRGTLAAKRLMRKMLKQAKLLGAKEIYFSVPTKQENIYSWANNYGPPIEFVFKRKI